MCAAVCKCGVDYTIVRWIIATLEGLLAAATLVAFSKRVAASRGCPQGDVLLLLVWCLLVAGLIATLSGGGIYTQGYVDDICLLAVGKFSSTVSGLKQWALHTVEMWCDKGRLLVNPNRTGLIVFTRKRKLPGYFESYFFGVTLHCCMLVRYLGVVLNSWLTWREHVDVKVRKAHNMLYACRRGCGVIWGLRPKVVHWLYISIITPSIIFASLVWWPGCQMASAKKRLSMLMDNGCDVHHFY